LEGQENERRRLAKDIHDGIGPLMSTIKMNIESCKKDMGDASEKTLKKMENVEELIQEVANDIRGISHALVPSALNDFGLISTLENLILKANHSETINIKFFNSGMNQRLDPLMELGLYRIIQELLNNALKYSKAKNITIQIIKHPKDITLTVEDDGVGFNKENMPELINSGIGLRNIETRTIAMGGVFSIDTSPGNGVMSTIEVPL
jgi:signal transduction histidine kinase